MQAKIFFVILALSLFITTDSQGDYQLGGECASKAIVDDSGYLAGSTYGDYRTTYHGISSCISLRSQDDSGCCYMKLKFKNKVADKKFTHRGCVVVRDSDWADVTKFVKVTEQLIQERDTDLEKIDVDIDCNSKFIKLTRIILLSFLL